MLGIKGLQKPTENFTGRRNSLHRNTITGHPLEVVWKRSGFGLVLQPDLRRRVRAHGLPGQGLMVELRGRAYPKRGAEFRSEEHTSELQSRGLISYAAFCLTKKFEPPSGGRIPSAAFCLKKNTPARAL